MINSSVEGFDSERRACPDGARAPPGRAAAGEAAQAASCQRESDAADQSVAARGGALIEANARMSKRNHLGRHPGDDPAGRFNASSAAHGPAGRAPR